MSTQPTGGLLRYPYEAITQNTDYLQIRIFKYKRADITGGPTPSEGQAFDVSNYVSNKAKVLSEDGVIILPMPSNIQDSNVVSYDNDSMNAFAAAGVSAVQSVMGGGGKAVSDFISGTGSPDLSGADPNDPNKKFADAKAKIAQLFGDQKSLQNATTTRLAIEAVNVFGANVSFNSLLARSDSKILNPNMELLFNNVTLRTFRFSFKFAPRDPNEATAVKSIIRSFKKNMAAQKTGDADIFLQTPNIFKLTYRKGNQNHPFLHRFKDCALSDMSVQYTGDNVYATYSDGTPISMIMNLTFKEMVPIYSSDYESSDDGNDENGNPITFNDGDMIYGAESNSSKNVEGVGF
jgi:hypothetical protein